MQRKCTGCPSTVNSHYLSLGGNFGLSRQKTAGAKLNEAAVKGERTIIQQLHTSQNIKENLLLHNIPEMDKSKTSSCSNIRAGQENGCRSRSQIFDKTVVFEMFCARHDTPITMVDMYHGVKYAYPDFLLQKHMESCGSPNQRLHIYYDIACKYKTNLENRFSTGETSRAALQQISEKTFVVPKMHAYCHNYGCLRHFHSIRVEEAGLTCGEASERKLVLFG